MIGLSNEKENEFCSRPGQKIMALTSEQEIVADSGIRVKISSPRIAICKSNLSFRGSL